MQNKNQKIFLVLGVPTLGEEEEGEEEEIATMKTDRSESLSFREEGEENE